MTENSRKTTLATLGALGSILAATSLLLADSAVPVCSRERGEFGLADEASSLLIGGFGAVRGVRVLSGLARQAVQLQTAAG